jgi:hypothetical protein
MASGEPYLIQSGPYRELVISQPNHISEFYAADAKDEPPLTLLVTSGADWLLQNTESPRTSTSASFLAGKTA